MPTPAQTVQNSFIAGLKTEFTGLNFPANAATDTQNCVYTLVGDVQRRGGINFENGFGFNQIDNPGKARSSFRWLNAGGDGQSQILVEQIGQTLYFFLSSSATASSPLSKQRLGSIVNLFNFAALNNTSDVSISECQFTSGNGYLFVYHPNCDPFYCTYTFPNITATRINVQIRDTVGIPEGIADNFRPPSLSQEHLYNLLNQGWTQGSGWTGTGVMFTGGSVPCVGTQIQMQVYTQSASNVLAVGNSILVHINQMATIGANNGNNNFNGSFTCTINQINAQFLIVTCTSITYNCTNTNLGFWSGGNFTQLPNELLSFTLLDEGFINSWFGAFNNYPSNSDVWWLYKDTSNAFNPSATFPNVQALNSPAPKGTFILSAFQQQRSSVSTVTGLTDIIATSRPSTGAFYAGRVWYAGINSSQQAQGDEPFTTWTENLYFSQIVENPINFGRCYQNNDPTSENLFDILPSDGGVITIQGCGAIYKLFALRFGLLVFASNGIWFIGGSSGIGFTATDFSVTKISSIKSISGTSFIDVQGFPFFWNQEGIYQVAPSAQAGSAHSPDIQLDVQNLTLGTILTYYDGIPFVSKSYARGDYDYLNYVIQWCYRSTPESSISNRYRYDTILVYNTVTKAFYPYTLPPASSAYITDIKYIDYPGGTNNGLNPSLKYTTIYNGNLTFSEENDFIFYLDFINTDTTVYNYTSYFVTGYMLPGQALNKVQIPYVYVFSRNPNGSKCIIQAIWDYVTTTSGGKESTRQIITMKPNSLYRKVRLRGRGMAVQIKVQSIQGQPLDLMGWSVLDQVNQVV